MRERSNSWNTAQQKKKREARRKLREDRDYNPDAHREKDTERATGRASKKIKKCTGSMHVNTRSSLWR
ncbi:hypothetical protein RU639_003251 [Aspergillus parasiticus]